MKDLLLEVKELITKQEEILNSLYKLEAKLHKEVYKDAPVIKTDREIIEGICKLGKKNIKQKKIK